MNCNIRIIAQKFISILSMLLAFFGLHTQATAEHKNSMKLVWEASPSEYQKQLQKIQFYYNGEQVLNLEDAIFTIPYYGYAPITPHNSGEYLIIHSYSGGAHCCSKVRIFQIDNAFKELVSLDIPGSGAQWQDVNNDGIMELLTNDYTFDYWHTFHADSALPAVILRFDGTTLQPAGDLMKTPRPALTALLAEAHQIRDDMKLWEKYKPGSDFDFPGIITRKVLNLLYGGHPDLAARFIQEAWSVHNPQKEYFIRELKNKLTTSLFWQQLTQQGFKSL